MDHDGGGAPPVREHDAPHDRPVEVAAAPPAWLKLPADATKLLPELQQLYRTYQVEHAALLEQLHAHQQLLATGGDSQRAAAHVAAAGEPSAQEQPAQPLRDAEGDELMREAGAEGAANGGDVSWPSVRQLIAARLRVEGAGPTAAAAPAAADADPHSPQQQEADPGMTQQRTAGGERTADGGASGPPAREAHGDERLGRGSAAAPPLLSDVRRLLEALEPGAVPVAGPEDVARWQEAWAGVEERALAQERVASAVSTQWMDAQGAMACLCGDLGRYLLRRSVVSIGRACDSHPGEVDLDLSAYPGATKISRLQAALRLDMDGSFWLTNFGRRELYVNGDKVTQGESVTLPHLSLLEIANCKLLFLVNFAAVKRAIARSRLLRE